MEEDLGISYGCAKQYLYFLMKRSSMNRIQLAIIGRRMLEAMAS